MAEVQHTVHQGYLARKQTENIHDSNFIPYWASHVQYAQNLLECSDEPIIYEHDDQDYQDNCFFFPEDCSWTPLKDYENSETETDATGDLYYYPSEDDEDDGMIPGLPDIKMLDAEALSDLLDDNLSPPEITSIIVFATNGAIFAHASPLSTRQLRNLSATYGAAYTCYAKNASNGNLTGVNPASHPSSYVTAQSFSLSGVGSIVFELDDNVAVVTRIADKVLLAAVGPSKVASQPPQPQPQQANEDNENNLDPSTTTTTTATTTTEPTKTKQTTTTTTPTDGSKPDSLSDHLECQFQIDRTADLARLESLNLATSPAILLALESKSAALGKFLGQKLACLESPDDF